jgi:hypothetical protein
MSRRHNRSVSPESNPITSIGSDEFYARLVRRQHSSKEHLLIPGGGLIRDTDGEGGCRFRPVEGKQSSALGTLRMIEYQRPPEQQHNQSSYQHAIRQDPGYRIIPVHQRTARETIQMPIDRGMFDRRLEQHPAFLHHSSAHKHRSLEDRPVGQSWTSSSAWYQ